MAGQILPGGSGLVYLTDVLYKLGWQATDRLALPEKNAEVAIAVPDRLLPRLADGSSAVEYLGVVPEWPAGSGRSFRRGGGHQWVVNQAISLPVYPWSWIPLEVP